MSSIIESDAVPPLPYQWFVFCSQTDETSISPSMRVLRPSNHGVKAAPKLGW